MPTTVLIAGGGPAAVEAAFALDRLAGDRVATTLLAPEADLTYLRGLDEAAGRPAGIPVNVAVGTDAGTDGVEVLSFH